MEILKHLNMLYLDKFQKIINIMIQNLKINKDILFVINYLIIKYKFHIVGKINNIEILKEDKVEKHKL